MTEQVEMYHPAFAVNEPVLVDKANEKAWAEAGWRKSLPSTAEESATTKAKEAK